MLFDGGDFLVFGLGKTTKSVINFLQKHYNSHDVFISNDNTDELDCFAFDKQHKMYDIQDCDFETKLKKVKYLIISPSVHADYKPHNVVVLAKKHNIKLLSPTDLFCDVLEKKDFKKMVCITGTNGKSTTTALVSHILNDNGFSAVCCENFDEPITDFSPNNYDYFVAEMSSYRLFVSNSTRFNTSCLLNITPDHLEYHGTIEQYVAVKKKALEMSNNAIVCIDYDNTKKVVDKISAIKQVFCVSKNNILTNKNSISWSNGVFYFEGEEIFRHKFQNLIGKHNVENILCAVATVFVCSDGKVSIRQALESVKGFSSLKHRMQFVKNIDGVDFINDSKGTNADSTQKALLALYDKDVYLIAGGRRKTDGFLAIKNDLKNVKCVFLIGEATDSFAKELDELGINYVKSETIKTATNEAFLMAKENNKQQNNKTSVVLLSPLCASFDQYSGFEERGDDFINIVNGIIL